MSKNLFLIELPSQLESLRKVRKAHVRGGQTFKAAKGGGYQRRSKYQKKISGAGEE